MMPFKLTLEYARSILDPAEKGDWQPFADAVDPEVHWWIVSDESNNYTKAGVYVCFGHRITLFLSQDRYTKRELELGAVETRFKHSPSSTP
jgi:hypothetical protein